MIIALIVILIAVLVLPFMFHEVEENLEAFLFLMGVTAALVSGNMTLHLFIEALREPVSIALAVLAAGALFFILHDRFTAMMDRLFQTRSQKIVVCVIACFSIGLGAVLTPIGEPLATIAVSKLNEGFFYLMNSLGEYIIPIVFAIGGLGALYTRKVSSTQPEDKSQIDNTQEDTDAAIGEDSWESIIIRALKVYLFVMALVFLGDGFQPLIDAYILGLDNWVLYWVNMVSAILDNATLASAEISPQMNALQIKAILMGLLISGGMLVPGNIPNIISASKLKISMTEWAKIGTLLGLIIMAIFYFVLF